MSESNSRTRTITWNDPMETAAAAASMRGLDFLKAMAEGDVPKPPIADLMDFRIVDVEEGRAVFEGLPAEIHYNPIGVVHGGLAATLFDSAMGCAVHSVLPPGAGYTTLEIKVNYLRPLTSSTGPVRCEAKVVHAGKRVATAEARLVDADGRLYGHATTTCMVFPAEEVAG